MINNLHSFFFVPLIQPLSLCVIFSATTSPGVTLDRRAINVKSSAPRHPCCITVIISNIRRDDKMPVFRRCGGQKPSHNICIITLPENVSCDAERVGHDCFFDNSFSIEWKEQFSLSKFYPFIRSSSSLARVCWGKVFFAASNENREFSQVVFFCCCCFELRENKNSSKFVLWERWVQVRGDTPNFPERRATCCMLRPCHISWRVKADKACNCFTPTG